jgi:phospholipid/cholesterol/gamma-HCH transport system substrate-binding protein
MLKQQQNNLKLGIFIITGFLVLLFFIIIVSKKRNLFGSDFELKTHFSNLNGLMRGDNVSFSGLQAGSVKKIAIVDDTTIEVDLAIDEKLKAFIPKNTTAAVITDGIVGDKIVNLIPGRGNSGHVDDGDFLQPGFSLNKDEELKTLSRTNNNMQVISEIVKNRIGKVDTSALLSLLSNRKVAVSLLSTLDNLNVASARAKELLVSLNDLVKQTRRGDGALGALLTDSVMAGDLKTAIKELKTTAIGSSKATDQLNELAGSLRQDIEYGDGTLHVLLKDTVTANNINKITENLRNGTNSFSQDMEALKHNFFLRGYFRRQERQNERARLKELKAAQDSSRKSK